MPVRWTADLDQLLLLKILEVHDLSIDAKRIAAAWPTDRGEVPSARAITERLVKIRSLARGAGTNFTISSSQSKGTGTRSKPNTPRKAKDPSATPGSKRKRVAVKAEDEDVSGSDNVISAEELADVVAREVPSTEAEPARAVAPATFAPLRDPVERRLFQTDAVPTTNGAAPTSNPSVAFNVIDDPVVVPVARGIPLTEGDWTANHRPKRARTDALIKQEYDFQSGTESSTAESMISEYADDEVA